MEVEALEPGKRYTASTFEPVSRTLGVQNTGFVVPSACAFVFCNVAYEADVSDDVVAKFSRLSVVQ